jgi:ribosomal protein S16
MLLRELFDINEKMAWAKRGNKVVRKYRCTSGSRAGRIVSDIGQCFAPVDVKKRTRLKLTKARLGSKMARKAKKTKRVSAASKRVKALNR